MERRKLEEVVILKCDDCNHEQMIPNKEVIGQPGMKAIDVFKSGIENKLFKCPECGRKNLSIDTQ